MCVCICGFLYIYIYIYYANDDSFTCAAVFVFGCGEYIFCYLFIIFTLCVVQRVHSLTNCLLAPARSAHEQTAPDSGKTSSDLREHGI